MIMANSRFINIFLIYIFCDNHKNGYDNMKTDN